MTLRLRTDRLEESLRALAKALGVRTLGDELYELTARGIGDR